MVLITDGAGGGPPLVQIQQNGAIIDEVGACRYQDKSSLQTTAKGEEKEAPYDENEEVIVYYDDDDDVYQEFEEFDFSDLPDTKSIASDDSFYPPDDNITNMRSPSPESPEPISFFKACCNNNGIITKIMIRQGVTPEEVKEVDKNNRTGLIVACCQGFVDVVIALTQCPFLDVNWQDNEGNTALITAAQAGHIMITLHLLNYFPGLDIERRNCHGFTATMKAAMQGRAECVRSLMMSGGDIDARDYGRKMTPREWALFTGRHETANLMLRLMARPCAEQFCSKFRMEWPMLRELVAQAQAPKSRWRRLTERVCCTLNFSGKTDPLDDGVLNYTVHVTTALASSFIAPVCRTVCPGSPPCVGKRRPAVREILRRQRLDHLRSLGPERLNDYKRLFQSARVQLVPKKLERRASLQPQLLHDVAVASTVAPRRSSLLSLHMMRPKVRLCKAPKPTYTPERLQKPAGDTSFLQVPKWKYKEVKEPHTPQVKEERKMAEQTQNKLMLPAMQRE